MLHRFNVAPNPYTWFTMEALEETWKNLQSIIKIRNGELDKEEERQRENDKLRQDFAKNAHDFHSWLTETRISMMEGTGTLEEQLAAVGLKAHEVRIQLGNKTRLAVLYRFVCLGKILEFKKIVSLSRKSRNFSEY